MEAQVDMVVLAAGKGVRMQSSKNKMFHKLQGLPILYRTLSRMNSNSMVKRIVLVIQKRDEQLYEQMLTQFGTLSKIEGKVWGGNERSDSVKNGLKYVLTNPVTDIVMTHDGARPFFTDDLVLKLSKAAQDHKIAVPALRIYETIRHQSKYQPSNVVDRKNYFVIQTPQAFQVKDIETCFFSPEQQSLNLTDEASYFENKNHETYLVDGEKWNIKITTKDDIAWGEMMLNYFPFLKLKSVEKL